MRGDDGGDATVADKPLDVTLAAESALVLTVPSVTSAAPVERGGWESANERHRIAATTSAGWGWRDC